MTNFRMRQFPKKKNTYGLKEIDDALKQAKLERHHDDLLRLNLLKIILPFLLLNKGRNVGVKYVDMRNYIEAPAIGAAPAIEPPAVSVPVVSTSTIGSSSSVTEIGAVVVRVCSQLKEHVRDSTLPLRDTPLLGQYQFFSLEKTVKRKREGRNKKEDGKRKKVEPETWQRDLQQKIKRLKRIKKGKGERQKKTNTNKKNKKAEEADVPLKKKGTKIGDLTNKQLDHTMVAKADIVFFDLEEVVGEAYQASVDQTIVVSVEEQTMEVAKTEEEVGQASAEQAIVVFVEEQTTKVIKTEDEANQSVYLRTKDSKEEVEQSKEENVDEASQTKESKEEVEQSKDEVIEGKDDDDGNSQNKPDPVQDEKNHVNQVWSLRKDKLSPEAKKDNKSTYRRIGKETVCLNVSTPYIQSNGWTMRSLMCKLKP
ncbi:hypothetical protein GIB67_041981 [Kingdonia uniflora]|uniref:Uncharacterized protein n=1 Tax=Kingdonia uniflora TaxID=39325 RepID=A0A7J7P0F8_9MAGN|nr:hypothetical protein GIB67_041981 [Kingdonia uniflora]